MPLPKRRKRRRTSWVWTKAFNKDLKISKNCQIYWLTDYPQVQESEQLEEKVANKKGKAKRQNNKVENDDVVSQSFFLALYHVGIVRL